LTVCLSGRLESLPYGGLPSAVCGLYSFIRSPFVDGLPLRRLENLPYGGLRFTVHRPQCSPPKILSYLTNVNIKSHTFFGFEYNQAGTALWAIVIVVWLMDFLSAEVRKRVV
jgi:hypothetical protein